MISNSGSRTRLASWFSLAASSTPTRGKKESTRSGEDEDSLILSSLLSQERCSLTLRVSRCYYTILKKKVFPGIQQFKWLSRPHSASAVPLFAGKKAAGKQCCFLLASNKGICEQ